MSRAHDMDCEQVRKQAYRYRRGELIGAETGAIDAHLDDCATCRDYYERLGILLGAATSWEPSEQGRDADYLFAGIAARIEAGADESSDEVHDVDAFGFEDDDDEVYYDVGPKRWVSGVIGLAAGVLLTLGGFYLFQQIQQDGASFSPREATVEHDREAQPRGGDLQELARQESASPQVEVFASSGAKWSLTEHEAGGAEDLVLELQRGALLVEFVPSGGRTLRVEAPDMSVRVVGTVFYVSTDDDGPRAGVLAGEVEVSSSDGQKRATLGAERELSADFEPRVMPEARRERLSRLVDPEAHRRKLSALDRPARDKPTGRAKPRKGRVEEQTSSDDGVDALAESEVASKAPEQRLPPDLERLRARAERATRHGSYHDAVRYYRSLLDRLPPVHPIAASVHLDLAHIYLHRLNSPGRAAPHLRTFVERWPSDVAAESARRELCKIDASERGCGVER